METKAKLVNRWCSRLCASYHYYFMCSVCAMCTSFCLAFANAYFSINATDTSLSAFLVQWSIHFLSLCVPVNRVNIFSMIGCILKYLYGSLSLLISNSFYIENGTSLNIVFLLTRSIFPRSFLSLKIT